jgi:hypothetical protein
MTHSTRSKKLKAKSKKQMDTNDRAFSIHDSPGLIVKVIVKRRRTVIESLWRAASFQHVDTGALAAFEGLPVLYDLQ